MKTRMNRAASKKEIPINSESRRAFLSRLAGGVVAAGLGGLTGRAEPLFAQAAPAADDWLYLSATKLAQAIRNRSVSSEQLVNAYLQRIAEVNPQLNAVVQVAAETARVQARQADEALARGEVKGPLHGVPMTIKDSFDTAGVISTGGTKGRAAFVPATDATVVARLRAAGAILLGKTNTPELTLAFETANLVYGRTNHPYNLARSPGGSSGGAAALLTVGGSPLDLGSDTMGSIRWPSHCCGIAGIKPTSGRVSRAGHIVSHGIGVETKTNIGFLTQIGPMARFVEDLALTLPIIAGVDSLDPAVESHSLGDPALVDLKGLRVAFHTDNGIAPVTTETANVVKATATALRAAGLIVEEKTPDLIPSRNFLSFTGDGGAYLRQLLQNAGTPLNQNQIHPWTQDVLSGSVVMSDSEWSNFLTGWDSFKTKLISFMQPYDIILCPVNASPAPFHGGTRSGFDFSYTFAYNVAGWPAAVIRAGTTSTGLPIGVQVVGKPWREDVVLAVAQQIELLMGGWRPVPRPQLKYGSTRPPQLTWTGFAALQSAERVDGPWSDVLGAKSPYTVPAATKLYRLRQ